MGTVGWCVGLCKQVELWWGMWGSVGEANGGRLSLTRRWASMETHTGSSAPPLGCKAVVHG